ncbi:HPP family protein [Calderihabitans maritimus]|uniref:HPP family protein n=1 Tax=Calderihabitans maritimus TaxID=1246530 RepID=A0A1Z5HXA1_9FIRM|nr:HPP family protein [Calderihabitans maritimus]GAW93961.1 HPP family protein [Calderihabitans maritimus]
MKKFLEKMRGRQKSPERESAYEILWSWIGSFLGISAVGFISQKWLEPRDLTLIIGSFGASAVLIYAAIKSPLAQPRNLMLGHIISALVGVTCYKLVSVPWLSAALAVSLAIVAMHLTKSLHPPGGATALIAVIGGPKIHALGYLYVIIPVGLGALTMLCIALICNNLAEKRRYPEFWY